MQFCYTIVHTFAATVCFTGGSLDSPVSGSRGTSRCDTLNPGFFCFCESIFRFKSFSFLHLSSISFRDSANTKEVRISFLTFFKKNSLFFKISQKEALNSPSLDLQTPSPIFYLEWSCTYQHMKKFNIHNIVLRDSLKERVYNVIIPLHGKYQRGSDQ